MLSLSEVAKYGIAISISLMMTTAVGVPISMYFNRMAHELLRKKILTKAFNLFFALVAAIALLAYGVFYFFIDLNALRWNFSQEMINLSIVIFFSSTINWSLINVINTLGDGKSYSLLSISTIGFGVLLSYWFCTAIKNSHLWWIFGGAVSQIAVSMYAFNIIVKMEKQRRLEDEESAAQIAGGLISINSILSFAVPVSVIAMLGSFLINWFKWISFDGLIINDLGLVVGCFIFSAGLFNAVEQTSAAIFQPHFYKDLSSQNESVKSLAWNRYAERMIGTLILAFAAYLATIEYISKIVLSNQFNNEIWLLMVCGIADFIRVICNILIIRYDSTMKTRNGLVPSFFATLILVLFLISAGDDINLYAVPLISIATFTVLLFGHLIKLSVDGYSFSKTFATKTISLSIVVGILIAILVWLAGYADLNYFFKSSLCLLLGLFGFGSAWIYIIKPHNI